MLTRHTKLKSFAGTVSFSGESSGKKLAFTSEILDNPAWRNGWVAFSGRLDGRGDLARSLSIHNEAFVSDEEMACAAFERWQEAAPAHLTGDFAIAVWHERERRLMLAAD